MCLLISVRKLVAESVSRWMGSKFTTIFFIAASSPFKTTWVGFPATTPAIMAYPLSEAVWEEAGANAKSKVHGTSIIFDIR
mmetsp:Transcript_4287/g.13441  ORF Transcript_4287/g.13441 Transcript_4287/m.13441 type:complete len:81 (-) Transcript_4287:5093-5335(-)